jgi:hypothetical protein
MYPQCSQGQQSIFSASLPCPVVEDTQTIQYWIDFKFGHATSTPGLQVNF